MRMALNLVRNATKTARSYLEVNKDGIENLMLAFQKEEFALAGTAMESILGPRDEVRYGYGLDACSWIDVWNLQFIYLVRYQNTSVDFIGASCVLFCYCIQLQLTGLSATMLISNAWFGSEYEKAQAMVGGESKQGYTWKPTVPLTLQSIQEAHQENIG